MSANVSRPLSRRPTPSSYAVQVLARLIEENLHPDVRRPGPAQTRWCLRAAKDQLAIFEGNLARAARACGPEATKSDERAADEYFARQQAQARAAKVRFLRARTRTERAA